MILLDKKNQIDLYIAQEVRDVQQHGCELSFGDFGAVEGVTHTVVSKLPDNPQEKWTPNGALLFSFPLPHFFPLAFSHYPPLFLCPILYPAYISRHLMMLLRSQTLCRLKALVVLPLYEPSTTNPTGTPGKCYHDAKDRTGFSEDIPASYGCTVNRNTIPGGNGRRARRHRGLETEHLVHKE